MSVPGLGVLGIERWCGTGVVAGQVGLEVTPWRGAASAQRVPRHRRGQIVAGGSMNLLVTEMGSGEEPVGGDGESCSSRQGPREQLLWAPVNQGLV